MNIWMTSDLHLGHQREFLYEPRGFTSIEEHDAAIIKNWNSVVQDDDIVYILGDTMLNDNENGIKLWNELRGEKHVILGNHDSAARIELLKQAPRTIIEGYAIPFKYRKYNFFLSHYPSLCSNYDVDMPLKTRTINVCGHCHTKDKFKDMDKGLCYHVELDAHNNYPVLLDNIIEDIKEYLYES